MPNEKATVYEALAQKIAHLYPSSELAADEPVEPVEVLDALITEARELPAHARQTFSTEEPMPFLDMWRL